jgi:hypothetical protein
MPWVISPYRPQEDDPLAWARPRLEEFGVPALVRRFQATSPPSDAVGEFDALLEKLLEAIAANGCRDGPPSRWEQEALRKLYAFAEEEAPSFPPVDPAGVAPIHQESETPEVKPTAMELPKPITSQQFGMLVAFAKEVFGKLDIIPGRDVTRPALETKLGRGIRRNDYRAVMNKAFPDPEKRKGGRPKEQT